MFNHELDLTSNGLSNFWSYTFRLEQYYGITFASFHMVDASEYSTIIVGAISRLVHTSLVKNAES